MIAIAEENLPEKNDGTYKNNEEQRVAEFEVFDLDVSVVQLETEEDLSEKVISYIEKLIRKSLEYRSYINYLKSEVNLTRCSLIPGLDANEAKFSLEFHHYPLNLFEITSAIAKKKLNDLEEGEYLSCFEVADIVMREHYKNNIGLVPLSSTLHKMAHNKAIFIPYDKIYGNYEAFMKEYGDYLDSDVAERVTIDKLGNASKDVREYNAEKLKKKVVNFKIDYKKNDE
jgi:hypothetical protein